MYFFSPMGRISRSSRGTGVKPCMETCPPVPMLTSTLVSASRTEPMKLAWLSPMAQDTGTPSGVELTVTHASVTSGR